MVFLGKSATQFRKFMVIQRQLCLRRIFIRLFMGEKHSETVCQKWVLAMQVCVQFPVAVLQMNLFQFPFGFGSGTFLICTLFTTFSFLTLSDLFKAMKMLSVNANPRTVWLLIHIVFILYFPKTYTCNIFVHILYVFTKKKKKVIYLLCCRQQIKLSCKFSPLQLGLYMTCKFELKSDKHFVNSSHRNHF